MGTEWKLLQVGLAALSPAQGRSPTQGGYAAPAPMSEVSSEHTCLARSLHVVLVAGQRGCVDAPLFSVLYVTVDTQLPALGPLGTISPWLGRGKPFRKCRGRVDWVRAGVS